MAGNYDVEHLIALVRMRPVLWNKTLDTYKDKLLTKKAWQEICYELDSEYDLKTEDEKQEYARDVMKKWWNVRDNFVKICKKMTMTPGPVKKYVYHNLLQFLPITGKKANCEPADTENSMDSALPEDLDGVHSDFSGDDSFKRPPQPFSNKKRKLAPPSCRKYTPTIVPSENRHISFFKGIIPSLESFDDDDIIQFQMGVLQLIADIRSNNRMNIAQQASSSSLTCNSSIKMEYS